VSDVRHHSVRVPATSANLGPGFDAFGIALTRHLVVHTAPRGEQEPRVTTVGEGAGELSTGDDNLIWRSLVTFCRSHEQPVPDVALHVVNDLPLERGLGSSSSAIVAGLVLGRALTGLAVADRDLVDRADQLEGHPDNVAPALLGGLVACTRDADGALVVRRRNPAPPPAAGGDGAGLPSGDHGGSGGPAGRARLRGRGHAGVPGGPRARRVDRRLAGRARRGR
jgi:homoserine kinase